MGSDARREVEALLPHRPPFLFVDAIVDRGEGTILTEWHIRPELACFQGHYPGEPVLPGVLITEFALQSGALLIYSAEPEQRTTDGVPVLTRIENARFKKIVRPGETLRAEVRMDEELANARYMSARITSDGARVATLSFVLAIAPAPAPLVSPDGD